MVTSDKFQSIIYRALFCSLLLCSCLLVAGCGGCTEEDPQQTAEQEKSDKEKPDKEKENYENKSPVIFPGNYSDEIRTNRTKLGHWVTADVRMIANNFNAQGELLARPFNGQAFRPSNVERTNYVMRSVRPVSLPKEEWRNFEISVYLPKNKQLSNTTIDFEYTSNSSGLLQHATRFARTSMSPYQQHLVVLTNRPDAYGYVNVLDSVVIPDLTYKNERFPPFYYVVRTKPNEAPIPLPREPLNWTTIAYVVWDDLDPDQLDAGQQQALVDWLYFGGQLILSGPDCLDKLQGSFLAEYLPAKFNGTRNLTSEDLLELNEHWAVPIKNIPQQKYALKSDEKSPLLGLNFEPHPEASYVANTGEIAIERMLGRGRVVATSFSLDDAPVVAWPSYQSFFNGCLLRRPARQFGKTANDTLSFQWRGDTTHIMDPMLATTLRYTSRDLSSDGTSPNFAFGINSMQDEQADVPRFGFRDSLDNKMSGFDIAGISYQPRSVKQRSLGDDWHYGGYQHDEQAGNAGWNDDSAISNAARQTLIESAGITPPSRVFVLQMLALYLVVLVPLNWLVFRLLGRVEWAWIAAPVIAIAGALWVAKMASLDIGFVRSNTQVALLEVYQGHPRGHLTQYSALYTSLSTGYELDLDNGSAQSLPFGLPAEKFKRKETLLPVSMRKTVSSRLEDFQVQSNTTGLLHTEMMLDLGGAFKYDDRSSDIRLENKGSVALEDAAIVRRLLDRSLEFVWIGELAPQAVVDGLQFKALPFVKGDPKKASQLRQVWAENNQSMESPVQAARKIWQSVAKQSLEDSDGKTLDAKSQPEEKVLLTQFRDVPELSDRWADFLAAVRRESLKDPSFKESVNNGIDYSTFEIAFRNLNLSSQINIGRLFDAIIDNLSLAPGEARLLGVTRQALGNNRFSPVATQTDQQTLVLVHLKRPAPLPARRDQNLLSDFGKPRSNLDWESEPDVFEEEEGPSGD